MTSLSEVAQLRRSIQEELEASRRGLSGLASVARHESINKRMGRLDELHGKLASHIGQDKATKFLLETEAIVYDQQDRRMNRHAYEKPTLMQVRREKGLQSSTLANAAGVPLRIEYQAEIGALVSVEAAGRILHALSFLTGETYTLNNVAIQVKHGVMV